MKLHKLSKIRCSHCGQFVGYSDKHAIVYVPYGGPTDTEPPDERYICGKCTLEMSSGSIYLIRSIAWMGPSLAFPYATEGVER